MNTRGLTGMVSQRIADTSVNMIYNNLTPDDDGSSTNNPIIEELFGSVQALQPKDIQRLQEGGIEVKNGVSLLVSKAQDRRPDKIVVNDKTWRVITWSFVREYLEDNGGSGMTERGTVVAVCDEILIGNAV
jgi:hypothetical protein